MSVPFVVPQPMAAAAAAANDAPVIAAQQQQQVQQAADNQQVNGPHFPNIQEEPEMQDWLDNFFSFTRLAIFVTVLYFNSSPLRCLLVMFIASVIYL